MGQNSHCQSWGSRNVRLVLHTCITFQLNVENIIRLRLALSDVQSCSKMAASFVCGSLVQSCVFGALLRSIYVALNWATYTHCCFALADQSERSFHSLCPLRWGRDRKKTKHTPPMCTVALHTSLRTCLQVHHSMKTLLFCSISYWRRYRIAEDGSHLRSLNKDTDWVLGEKWFGWQLICSYERG